MNFYSNEEPMKQPDINREKYGSMLFPLEETGTLDESDSINPNKTFDPVEKPRHYNSHPSGIECIQLTEHMNFCLGNAMKYIWRCEYKSDDVEDLQKAIWYLNREIRRKEKE